MVFKLYSTIACACLLAACGGGSSSSSNNNTNTINLNGGVSTGDGANVAKTIVGHSVGDPNTGPFTIGAGNELDSARVTANALTNFTVDNRHGGTMNVVASGLLTPGIADYSSGGQKVRLGGTQFTYARFGTYLSTQTNTNGLNSQYIERNAPFFMGTNYTASGVTANYSNGGKAVGTLTMAGVAKVELVCDANVSLVVTGATHQVTASLSNCNSSSAAVPVTGTVRYTRGGGVNSGGTPTTFTLTHGSSVYTVTSVSGAGFLMTGPNADEIVGSMNTGGNVVTGGTSTFGIFNFAFGVKK